MLSIALCVVALGVSGCTPFHEEHLFRSRNQETGAVVNYFRLRVEGFSSFSRARYVAGYYDERAVDLFFNEAKTAANGELRQPFEASLVSPGGTEKIEPLNPKAGNGAFLMLLSTNPKVVTDVIGQFMESENVAKAVVGLTSRHEIRALRRLNATAATRSARATAIAAELRALFGKVPATDGATPALSITEAAYLRVLNSIAAALGRNTAFKRLDDPAIDIWLDMQRTIVVKE
jgi:hypothetical protein